MRSEAVVEAIRQVADAEIMPRFQALADHEIIEKRPGDLVTVADRLAERALTDIFRREDPGCLVVGEEGMYADSTPLRQLPTAELAWVIDPVDGTRNFAGGSPDFAVMVAEVRSGVTTRSWIWQPVPEVMFFAELGGGVYRNGERLAVAAPSEPLVGALHGRWGGRDPKSRATSSWCDWPAAAASTTPQLSKAGGRFWGTGRCTRGTTCRVAS